MQELKEKRLLHYPQKLNIKDFIMQFIYQLKLNFQDIFNKGPTEAEEKILQQHLNYLTQLKNEKSVILAGRTQVNNTSCFGIVIFTAEDEAHANSIMQNDPAVKAGIMSATLFPFHIAIS